MEVTAHLFTPMRKRRQRQESTLAMFRQTHCRHVGYVPLMNQKVVEKKKKKKKKKNHTWQLRAIAMFPFRCLILQWKTLQRYQGKKIDRLQYQLKSWDLVVMWSEKSLFVKLPRHAGWIAMSWHQMMERSCFKVSREKKWMTRLLTLGERQV